MTEYKPFEIIEEQKKVIENLKYKLQYSKNKVKDANDINTLIKTLKCFDSMLVSKYKTNAIERLMYALIYELLMIHKVYEGKEIPLNEIKETLRECLSYDSRYKKTQVVSILESHELNNITNNFKKHKNYNTFDENLKNRRTDKNWILLLNQLVNKYKIGILWTK